MVDILDAKENHEGFVELIEEAYREIIIWYVICPWCFWLILLFLDWRPVRLVSIWTLVFGSGVHTERQMWHKLTIVLKSLTAVRLKFRGEPVILKHIAALAGFSGISDVGVGSLVSFGIIDDNSLLKISW